MAKQTFKEKVHSTKHLAYHRHDDAIKMNLELEYVILQIYF